jgi:hypothetical protein
MTSKNVYPITAGLETLIASFDQNIAKAIKAHEFVNIVREYEHGTADVRELGVTLKQYAAVTADILLYLAAIA